jgi:DNA-binding SARP family transcriptional activator
MPLLSVTLFGKFGIKCDNEALSGLDAFKVQELFCYLLLHRDRPHSREALAGLLWGDSSTSQSKKYLRQALWQLQSALEAYERDECDRLLLVDNDWININSQARFWFDVAAFEEAFARARGVRGDSLDAQSADALERAIELYEADLLEGWYQDWCLYERERLQNIYLAMLDKLMAHCEVHHKYEMGLVYGASIIRYDKARECTHRQMMRLQYLAGDRTSALRQYDRCIAALDEELGVKPDKYTRALYEQIRADDLIDSPRVALEAVLPPGSPSHSLPEVLSRLKRLCVVLTDIQRQVQQDINAVEMALNIKR